MNSAVALSTQSGSGLVIFLPDTLSTDLYYVFVDVSANVWCMIYCKQPIRLCVSVCVCVCVCVCVFVCVIVETPTWAEPAGAGGVQRQAEETAGSSKSMCVLHGCKNQETLFESLSSVLTSVILVLMTCDDILHPHDKHLNWFDNLVSLAWVK